MQQILHDDGRALVLMIENYVSAHSTKVMHGDINSNADHDGGKIFETWWMVFLAGASVASAFRVEADDIAAREQRMALGASDPERTGWPRYRPPLNGGGIVQQRAIWSRPILVPLSRPCAIRAGSAKG
jgi:hypothetical protein